jgi:hypothetical protein
MGIETFPSNHIPVSCGTCYVAGELGSWELAFVVMLTSTQCKVPTI